MTATQPIDEDESMDRNSVLKPILQWDAMT
jgi:hypothetical protein